jgi:hypothetical protein
MSAKRASYYAAFRVKSLSISCKVLQKGKGKSQSEILQAIDFLQLKCWRITCITGAEFQFLNWAPRREETNEEVF